MYQPSRCLSSFYIAGFKYYEGPFVLGKLKPGKKLSLVAEPDNPYDACAMAIYRKDAKLGFIPRDENPIPSLLAFYGHDILECRVQSVNPDAEPWEQVRVGLYLKDARC